MKVFKTLLLWICSFAPFLAGCRGGDNASSPFEEPLEAVITVDPSRTVSGVDTKIYGHFIENLGMCIYGGIWQDDPKVPTIHRGIRQDVTELLSSIRPSVIRWPGGCFSDGYHWTDGIGSHRPLRINRAWWPLNIIDPRIAPLDPNTFGTDEFMAFARALHAAGYINVNFGTGTAEEAAAWVAYCNASASDTTPIGTDRNGVDWGTAGSWAARRRESGQSEPYNVLYWGIGNEICGWWELGHTDSVSYARRLIEYHDKMKAVDPSIKLIAVGCDADWNETVLEIAAECIDYLSVHAYYPGVFETAGRGLRDDETDYYSILAAPIVLETPLDSVRSTLQGVLGPSPGVGISLDEWNLWWDYRQLLHTEYSLRDGLFAALVFIVLHRAGDAVGMANLAQMVNTIEMVNTTETDVVASPLYHAFKLFRDHTFDLVVPSHVDCPRYRSEPLGNIPRVDAVPFLDCSATRDETGRRLALVVVNRHYEQPLSAGIDIEDADRRWAVHAWELNGPGPHERNDLHNKERVGIHEKPGRIVSSSFTYTFPPHSASALVLSPL